MNSATPDIETIVIGGGVIGLAIAAECAKAGQETYLFERRDAIGQEVSSRSSDVVHAGLYYPAQSLKARMCDEGKQLLYAYAQERNVAVRQLGKLVVATSVGEASALDAIAETAKTNGVGDLEVLDAGTIRTLEPDVAGIKALFSPLTGIIDSHGLIHALEADFTDRGGTIALETEVHNVTHRADGLFEIELISGGETAKIAARYVFAAAGLGMAELGPMLPRKVSYTPPPLYFAKGHYFALRGKSRFQHLVYPVPVDGGLGTHLTLDLEGNVRFGPDVQWVDRIDHAFDEKNGLRLAEFERSIRRYWPSLPDGALMPSYTGIRPKTSRRGEPAQDFNIHGPRDHGIPHLIALYGIESPGLTSCLAIARYCVAIAHNETVRL
jgi:L-2-hydroxyglutarate oxidase LhgO